MVHLDRSRWAVDGMLTNRKLMCARYIYKIYSFFSSRDAGLSPLRSLYCDAINKDNGVISVCDILNVLPNYVSNPNTAQVLQKINTYIRIPSKSRGNAILMAL